MKEDEFSCLGATILQAKTGAACQSRVLAALLVLRGKGLFQGKEEVHGSPWKMSQQTESAQLSSQIINIQILLEITLVTLPGVRFPNIEGNLDLFFFFNY